MTRRRVLAGLGGTAAAGLAGCSGGSGGSTTTATSSSVRLGYFSPESGRYTTIGDQERRGFNLAIKHINNGDGLVSTDSLQGLSGDGVLGSTVESKTLSTGGSKDITKDSMRALANEEYAGVGGGVTGSIVQGMREVANKQGLPYFVGTSPLTGVTGQSCSPFVYREFYHAVTLFNALMPYLIEEFGRETNYRVLTDGSVEAQALTSALTSYVQSANQGDFGSGSGTQTPFSDQSLAWRAKGQTTFQPGTSDLTAKMKTMALSAPDVVFFNTYSFDLVNAIRDAREQFSSDTRIVAPILNRDFADSAGNAIDGIYGTTSWHPDTGAKHAGTLTDAFTSEYGSPPTRPARDAYVSTLVFADAVERAGSTDPEKIQSKLEGASYSLGAGSETLRGCDHQAERSVAVVRGAGGSAGPLSLEGVESGVTPACNSEPASDCSF